MSQPIETTTDTYRTRPAAVGVRFDAIIAGFPIYVQKRNDEVVLQGYQGFFMQGEPANTRSMNAPPRVHCTERWHMPLDIEVISPYAVAAHRVPLV